MHRNLRRVGAAVMHAVDCAVEQRVGSAGVTMRPPADTRSSTAAIAAMPEENATAWPPSTWPTALSSASQPGDSAV